MNERGKLPRHDEKNKKRRTNIMRKMQKDKTTQEPPAAEADPAACSACRETCDSSDSEDECNRRCANVCPEAAEDSAEEVIADSPVCTACIAHFCANSRETDCNDRMRTQNCAVECEETPTQERRSRQDILSDCVTPGGDADLAGMSDDRVAFCSQFTECTVAEELDEPSCIANARLYVIKEHECLGQKCNDQTATCSTFCSAFASCAVEAEVAYLDTDCEEVA